MALMGQSIQGGQATSQPYAGSNLWGAAMGPINPFGAGSPEGIFMGNQGTWDQPMPWMPGPMADPAVMGNPSLGVPSPWLGGGAPNPAQSGGTIPVNGVGTVSSQPWAGLGAGSAGAGIPGPIATSDGGGEPGAPKQLFRNPQMWRDTGLGNVIGGTTAMPRPQLPQPSPYSASYLGVEF